MISTSRAALAVRFIRAEAECAREASGSCDELAVPPFHLLHGEYAGDEEVAAPSSAALRSPASWGYAGVEGAATPRTPPVVSTTSRQSTQEKRREATPPFRLHRAGVRWRREGKPRRARHAPSFRPHVVGRRGSMARWKGIAISGELKSTAATIAGLQFQVSCIAPILPAPRINGMFLLHSTMASSSCTPPRQHPASKGKQLHACTRRILILGFRI